MSLFDLKTDASQLKSANMGAAQVTYRQVSATKPTQGAEFASGQQTFQWELSGTEHWIPSKTYFRLRYRLRKQGADRGLDYDDHIAPEQGMCGHMIQSVKFRMGGKDVCSIDDHIPEIESLRKRTMKSKMQNETLVDSLGYYGSDELLRSRGSVTDNLKLHPPLPNTNHTGATVPLTAFQGGNAGNGRVSLRQTAEHTLITLFSDHAADHPTAFNGAQRGLINSAAGLMIKGIHADAALTIPPIRCLRVMNGTLTGPIDANNLQGQGEAHANAIVFVCEKVAHLSPFDGLGARIFSPDENHNLTIHKPVVRDNGMDESRKERETLWQPPLPIFDVKHALPAGQYSLEVTPKSLNDFSRVVESWGAAKVAGTDYVFEVLQWYLYVATIQGPRVDNISYLIDMENINCTSRQVLTNSDQRVIDVSPSTSAVTIAFQDNRSLTDSRFSLSKFKAYDNIGAETVHDKLTSMYIQYAGQTIPQPHADPQFTDTQDFLTHRYLETQLALGAQYDHGGTESIQDWKAQGPYYHFQTLKDGLDRSTRLTLDTQYRFDGAFPTNLNALIFDHYTSVAAVTVTDGRISSVAVEKA